MPAGPGCESDAADAADRDEYEREVKHYALGGLINSIKDMELNL